MTEREQWQEAWTAAVAQGGFRHGLIAGVLIYVGEGDSEVDARTFIADGLSPATRDATLAAIAESAEKARKQLAAGSN